MIIPLKTRPARTFPEELRRQGLDDRQHRHRLRIHPHYKGIQAMYDAYHDQGFEVLDIPCNQFAGQTPGTDEEIEEFCTLNYNTKFPDEKSDVNGADALPLYGYLKEQKGFEGFGMNPAALAMNTLLKKIDKDYKNNPDIKWNFTKFIVDRAGNVAARFEPTVDMKRWKNLSRDCYRQF